MNTELKKAEELYVKKSYEDALVALLAYVAETDEDTVLQAYYIGLCYAQLNRLEDALVYLEQVVTSDANIARVYQCRLILSFIYTKTGRERMAEFELSKLQESGYESVQVFTALGFLAYEKKDAEKAQSCYEEALKMNAQNMTAMNGLGYVLADTDADLERAFNLCKKAVDNQPDNAAYLDSLGWVYFKQKKYLDARVYLKRALEKHPDHPVIKQHLQAVLDAEAHK